MKINKVSVFGTGTMGLGITKLIAMSDFDVILRSRTRKSLKEGLNLLKNNLEKESNKNKITLIELKKIQNHISGTTKLIYAGKNADFIIEAIVENLEAKKKLFKELDDVCPKHTIFASNTSSLSITKLSTFTKRPMNFLGLHFFNPPTKMKLIEVVRGNQTSNKTIKTTLNFIEKIGKNPIIIKDTPGFLVNRMMIPLINEAIFLLMKRVAKKEEIDLSMKLGANQIGRASCRERV